MSPRRRLYRLEWRKEELTEKVFGMGQNIEGCMQFSPNHGYMRQTELVYIVASAKKLLSPAWQTEKEFIRIIIIYTQKSFGCATSAKTV